ncbi:hypothetical protein Tco_1186891, partial [Tanacetum coccineum]
RSQEYQMVCTRLDIASADVGMLDKFDHGLQTDVQCSKTVGGQATEEKKKNGLARLRSVLPRSRIHNEKLVQTWLKGHSILSGDCDVDKNGKWSCIYAVGSQEYQMVCTRLDITSAM